MTDYSRQQRYRERIARAARISVRREAALREVLEIVRGSERPVGMRIRAIVEAALKEEDE